MFKKSLRTVFWITSCFHHCQCTLSVHPWWEPQSLPQGSWQLLHCCCFLSPMTQTRGTQSALESWCSAQCQCCRTSGCNQGQVSLCSDIFKRICDLFQNLIWPSIGLYMRSIKIYLLHLSIQVSPACLGAPLSFVPHRFVARMCVNFSIIIIPQLLLAYMFEVEQQQGWLRMLGAEYSLYLDLLDLLSETERIINCLNPLTVAWMTLVLLLWPNSL